MHYECSTVNSNGLNDHLFLNRCMINVTLPWLLSICVSQQSFVSVFVLTVIPGSIQAGRWTLIEREGEKRKWQVKSFCKYVCESGDQTREGWVGRVFQLTLKCFSRHTSLLIHLDYIHT